MMKRTLLTMDRVLTIVLGFAADLVQYIKEWLHFRKLGNRFPGPGPLSSLVMLVKLRFSLTDTKIISYIIHEVAMPIRTGQFWVGPLRFFFINDPNDVQCYVQNLKNFAKPYFYTKFVTQYIGDGLISNQGEKWRLHRKILAPTFYPESIKKYIGTFSEQSDIFVNLLRKHPYGHPLDVKPMITRISFDIILETIIGVRSVQQTHPNEEFFEHAERMHGTVSQRVTRPWLIPDFIFHNFSPLGRQVLAGVKLLKVYVEKVIQERLQIMDEQRMFSHAAEDGAIGGRQCCGVIDALVQHQKEGGPITDEDIRDEVLTHIAAGYETSAVSLQMILYMLARHPDVQEKLFVELENVFDGNGSKEVTLDMVQHMKYLEMVIKETNRLHPPSWLHAKTTGVDTPLVSCDLVLPKGSFVMISTKMLHSDPELYPNPEVFDPERFSPENSAQRHPFAYLPFGEGMRACIAKKFSMLELKVIISKIVWHYEIKPHHTYIPEMIYGITGVPSNGMWLRFLSRK